MKKIFCLLFILLTAFFSCLPNNANLLSTASTKAAEPNNLFTATYEQNFAEENINIKVVYTEKTAADFNGEAVVNLTLEKDEEKLKTFQKYVKKQVDSADVAFVFYPTTTVTNWNGENLPSATYTYTVTLPKNLRKKDVAVIPFKDYRTTNRSIPTNVSKESGAITFSGGETIYAYAVVYNGVYKDLILIGVILVIVLAICVCVKIYTVRKDNPMVLDKKKEKAIKKAKEAHKQNKKLAQALKRQKEKEKQERHTHKDF